MNGIPRLAGTPGFLPREVTADDDFEALAREEGLVVIRGASERLYADVTESMTGQVGSWERCGPEYEPGYGYWEGVASPVRTWTIEDRPAVVDPARQQKKTHMWHYDETFVERPPNFVLMMCHQAPEEGGTTEFLDGRVLLGLLTQDERALLATTRCRFTYNTSLEKIGSEWIETAPPDDRTVLHPSIRQQAGTGLPVYFGDQLSCDGWVDRLTGEPVDGMVELLDRTIHRAEPYSHPWRENDLLIFDNTTMLHRRGLEAVVGVRELSQSRLNRVPVEDASVHALAGQ
jgi:alpha-ketoglutarate-dependent taurine dioxygenase